MGDRANIIVSEGDWDDGVWLYTHWAGEDLPHILHAALSKGWRWDDAPYLTRIIFCVMVQGSEMDETGFGISTKEQDGSDRVLHLDVEKQTVTRKTRDGSKTWTFKEYVKNPPQGWWDHDEGDNDDEK